MPDDETPEEEEDLLEKQLRELDEKTAELRAKHASSLEIDVGMDQKMREIQERAGALKQARQRQESQQAQKTRVEGEANKGLGLGFAVAYTIVGVPLLGALIGYFIDNATHNNIWKGLCTVVGAVIGITMTVIMVNRSNGKP